MILEISPSLLPSVGIIALYLGFIVLLAEVINRVTETSGEITRKIVHIGSGQVLLLAWNNIPREARFVVLLSS